MSSHVIAHSIPAGTLDACDPAPSDPGLGSGLSAIEARAGDVPNREPSSPPKMESGSIAEIFEVHIFENYPGSSLSSLSSFSTRLRGFLNLGIFASSCSPPQWCHALCGSWETRLRPVFAMRRRASRSEEGRHLAGRGARRRRKRQNATSAKRLHAAKAARGEYIFKNGGERKHMGKRPGCVGSTESALGLER